VRLRAALAAAATLGLISATPALAETKTETADAGTVHAELTYTTQPDQLAATNIRLTITDSGVVTTDEHVPDDASLTPGGDVDQNAVKAADLDGDGTVEVVLEMYTGGAHCCIEAWIYHAGRKTIAKFADAGYRLRDLDGDGRPEFLTADASFAYAFSSYASSRFPLLVLDWQADKLMDVTRMAALRPRLLREASGFRKDYVKARTRIHRGRGHYDIGDVETVRSALAAYAADECTLGRCDRGLATVQRALRRHDVKPDGQRFERRLKKLLKSLGYLT
jgi:hypothetical protein